MTRYKPQLAFLFLPLILLAFTWSSMTRGAPASDKTRLLVISSYHSDYLWSIGTNEGFCDALLKLGYLDSADQVRSYTENDYVESSTTLVKKLWMDSKRKNSKEDLINATARIVAETDRFEPDLIFLGDDNAAKYLGNHYLDVDIPIVFWGVNNTPVKYGLADTAERPGHNVTGLYQAGYYVESIDLLKRLVPTIKSFAILADSSSSSRSHIKAIQQLVENGRIDLQLVDTVSTNDFTQWRRRALELQTRVDAFVVPQYAAMKDEEGNHIPKTQVANWYLNNIKIPEAANQKQFISEGLLAAVDDSAYNQGYEAVQVAHKILTGQASPETHPIVAPQPGKAMVNRQRAKALGIEVVDSMGVEEFIEDSLALQETPAAERTRIMVVSSYHRDYLWSQDTNRGVLAALFEFGYLDNDRQMAEFTQRDQVTSSRAVVRKMWMDTKRKNKPSDIAHSLNEISQAVDQFRPDILLLGDDNATNYVGNHYIDTDLPIVFWGVNGLPLKYGLLDSLDAPGHNVTGIYQAGYLKETVEHLKMLLPDTKTFAVLSDASPTGRSKAKELARLARNGELPLELIETVMTNSMTEWKRKALELNARVDAFFVLNHNTIKDEQGNPVDQLELGNWYLKNINKPDASHERQFVTEGMLCAVDDSGYKQGYEAVRMAHQILKHGKSPAAMPSYAPSRGPFLVNRQRARMLGLEAAIADNPLIDQYVDQAVALAR